MAFDAAGNLVEVDDGGVYLFDTGGNGTIDVTIRSNNLLVGDQVNAGS